MGICYNASMPRTYIIGWLQGFFDGEGHVDTLAHNLGVGNTDFALIQRMCDFLEVLGIDFRCYGPVHSAPPRLDHWTVRINRRDSVTRFINEVGSSAPAKQQAMAQLVEWFNRPNQPFRTRWSTSEKPTKVTLLEKIGNGISARDIARELGCHPVTLLKYRKKYNLPIQPQRNSPEPSAQEIHHLYWDKNLSLESISAMFGYRGKNVVKFMKRHNIPRRKCGHPFKISSHV